MKLQTKLALVMALATGLAIFATASVFFVIAAREQRDSVDDFLTARVQDISRTELDGGRRAPPGENVLDRNAGVLFRVELANGTVLIDDGLPPHSGDLNGSKFSTIAVDGTPHRMLVTRVEFGREGRRALVQVGRDIERDELALSRLRNRTLLLGAIGIGLAAAIGAALARRMTRPIVDVAGAAQEMARGLDLPTPIETERTDEVGDLARSFNSMLSALDVSREQQQRLVADASHELRTPLTSLRLRVDLLNSTSVLSEKMRGELISGVGIELERLTDLVAELVELASDPTAVDEESIELDLLELASNTVEKLVRTGSGPISLTGDSVLVTGRARMLERALSNLLVNARKYGGPGEIIVDVFETGFSVRDRGPGIPEDELPFVFERFFRGNEARLQTGNGIGLAIVTRVAEVHGGQTFARNAIDGGAIVGLTIDAS